MCPVFWSTTPIHVYTLVKVIQKSHLNRKKRARMMNLDDKHIQCTDMCVPGTYTWWAAITDSLLSGRFYPSISKQNTLLTMKTYFRTLCSFSEGYLGLADETLPTNNRVILARNHYSRTLQTIQVRSWCSQDSTGSPPVPLGWDSHRIYYTSTRKFLPILQRLAVASENNCHPQTDRNLACACYLFCFTCSAVPLISAA